MDKFWLKIVDARNAEYTSAWFLLLLYTADDGNADADALYHADASDDDDSALDDSDDDDTVHDVVDNARVHDGADDDVDIVLDTADNVFDPGGSPLCDPEHSGFASSHCRDQQEACNGHQAIDFAFCFWQI